MNVFTSDQLEDLRDLQALCQELGAEAVIIGAIAYRMLIDDIDRQTRDIDLAVALDLDEFARLQDLLATHGWTNLERLEHRWRGPHGAWIDLLPAGPSLRAQRKLVWPKSGFAMSLAGFDHVFQNAVERELGSNLRFKVITLPVLGLLKIAAYLDDKHRRAKDRIDLDGLLRLYEQDSDRLFSDVVFEAKLRDIELAGALLLGIDMRGLATDEDEQLVESFLTQVARQDLSDEDWLHVEDPGTRREIQFQQHLAVFAQGFRFRPIMRGC